VSNDPATVREALALLDAENGDHWTSQGLPRLDVLFGLVGEEVGRRELNEIAPGFSRAAARKGAGVESGAASAAAPGSDSAPPAPEVEASTLADDLRRHADATFRHALERAERRKAALEHLAAGGFTLKDLEPPTSPLQRRISAQNRAARRQLTS